MNEDQRSEPQIAKDAPGFTDQPESENTAEGEKIYDITPDLNISPIKGGDAEIPTQQPILADKIPTLKPIRPAPPQVSENKNKISTGNSGLKALRTFEGDVAEAMAKQRASLASIALAENRQKEGNESLSNKSSHFGKNLFYTVFSLFLVGAGLAGAYYLYSMSPLAPVPTIPPEQTLNPSLITSDSQFLLHIDNMGSSQILTAIQREMTKTLPPGSIIEIIPSTIEDGQIVRLGSEAMARIMGIEPPNILMRSLANPWMLGIHTDPGDRKNIFVIVTSEFFQNTFAGMLQWESVMADDLKHFLYPSSVYGITNVPDGAGHNVSATAFSSELSLPPGTTTAVISTSTTTTTITSDNSTSTIHPLFTLRGSFSDKIIRNKDVRVFRTTEGNILFLYSFIDNTKLVITNNEGTLSEIILRLEKQNSIR